MQVIGGALELPRYVVTARDIVAHRRLEALPALLIALAVAAGTLVTLHGWPELGVDVRVDVQDPGGLAS